MPSPLRASRPTRYNPRMAKKPPPSTYDLGTQTRVLILRGPEEMIKRAAFAQLRQAIDKELGASIEPVMLDGTRCQPAEVFDELRTMSLLQPFQLVVVDDADQFVSLYRDMVERYAESPADGATLVLRSVKWNSPKLDKLVEKVGAKVTADPLTAAEAIDWLIKRAVSHHQRKLDKACATTLVERLGTGLMRLDNELAKLALMVSDGETIPASMIDQLVGRGSDEQAWAAQEAVLAALAAPSGRGASPAGRAIEAVHELIDLANQPEVLVLYFVADLIRKLHLAAMLRKQGVKDFDIASQMKLWSPRKEAFFAVLRRLNEKTTGDLLRQIVRMDARSKSGYGKALPNLECFCATLTDELK
jgi:DNA polymerase-3 subunit delta